MILRKNIQILETKVLLKSVRSDSSIRNSIRRGECKNIFQTFVDIESARSFSYTEFFYYSAALSNNANIIETNEIL